MFTDSELTILYAALVNYTTAEVRDLLRKQGESELAASISPFRLAALALRVEAAKEEN